jgi:hypothetical protein
MTTKHLSARVTREDGNGSLHSSIPERGATLSRNVGDQTGVTRVTIQKQSFSIGEFCKLNDISRSLFYVLRVKGKAPRVMKVGRRTLISVEAAAEWRKNMEHTTNL